MVFSDDWLFPECLTKMTALAEANPSVGIVSSYRLIEAAPDCFGVPVERSVFPGREALRWEILGTAFPFGTPSTVMYRADLVRKAQGNFFPAGKFFFDLDVAFRILASEDFGFVHQVLSFTRDQPASIMAVAGDRKVWHLMHMLTVEQYGRQFLEPAEFDAHYAQVLKNYYRSLGVAKLEDWARRRRNVGLWKFHRETLASIGKKIDQRLLLKGISRAALEVLASPKDLLDNLRRAKRVSGQSA